MFVEIIINKSDIILAYKKANNLFTFQKIHKKELPKKEQYEIMYLITI